MHSFNVQYHESPMSTTFFSQVVRNTHGSSKPYSTLVCFDFVILSTVQMMAGTSSALTIE